MSFTFSDENLKEIDLLLKRYPDKKALILPVLWMVQKQDDYISPEAITLISSTLDIPYMYIYSVTTFYTMFRLTKPQKRIIEVCRTLSCELNGSEDIKKYLNDNYSEDYEIIEVECMGACSGAPMCTLEGKYIENLTTEKIDEVLHVN
jgi:NADH-quinone oxidoreductase subunit E